MQQHDDIVCTATTEDGLLAIVAGITTHLVRDTRRRHELSTVATIALGRLATGAALLGGSLKGQERISLYAAGDGPIGSLTAEVALDDAHAIGTRAYARNPGVAGDGAADIATAVGRGRLQVTKSYEIGQPYVGIVALQSGEIGPDLASYLRNSQQIPSVVALDVLADGETSLAAGGIIAQVMPNADESYFAGLEARAAQLPPVARLVQEGASPLEIIGLLTGHAPLRSYGEFSVAFTCRCTRERVETALLGLGRDELVKMAHEQERTEAICDFCKRAYYLASSEVLDLAARIFRRG